MLGKRSDWQIIRPGLGNRLSTQRSLDSTMEPFDEAICCRVVSSCSNPCGAEDRRLLVRVPGFKFSPTVGSYSNGDAKTTEPSVGTCNSIRRGSGNWKTFRSSCKSFHGCEKNKNNHMQVAKIRQFIFIHSRRTKLAARMFWKTTLCVGEP